MSIERLSHEVPWAPLLASQFLLAVELQLVKVGVFGRKLRPPDVNLPPSAAGVDAYSRGQERRGTKMRAETHQDKATIFQTALSEKIRAHVGLHRAQTLTWCLAERCHRKHCSLAPAARQYLLPQGLPETALQTPVEGAYCGRLPIIHSAGRDSGGTLSAEPAEQVSQI